MVHRRVSDRSFLFLRREGVGVERAVHRPERETEREVVRYRTQVSLQQLINTSTGGWLLPAMQWVPMERGRMRQRLFMMRRSVMLTCLRFIGRLLDDTVSRPSALQSSAPTCLTFDPSVHVSGDPCAHLSIGLVLVGGAYRVPQVPVPQTCQSQIGQKLQQIWFDPQSCHLFCLCSTGRFTCRVSVTPEGDPHLILDQM